jgi:hypothetical protein
MKESYIQWIDIKQEKPEIGKKVLVRVQDKKCIYYFEDHLTAHDTWGQALDDFVTHWILLPITKCPTCGR